MNIRAATLIVASLAASRAHAQRDARGLAQTMAYGRARSGDSVVSSRVSTGRLAFGALLGGAVGAAASMPLLPTAFRSGDGMSASDLYGGVALLSLTESVGLAAGAYAANHRRGNLALATTAALGTGLAGVVLATGLSKGVGPSAFVIVPVSQIAAAIAILR